jgi:hypothetical protein
LREALLRNHMAPISRIARADLPVTAELEPFKMPQGKPTIERLSAAANGMAKAARPFSPVFVSAGLPLETILPSSRTGTYRSGLPAGTGSGVTLI